jgi:hypothetical protein
MKKRTSEETRKKMSIYHKRHPIKYWLGKKHSDEYKEKMSIVLKGRKHSSDWVKKQADSQRGEKAHQWRGGISSKNKIIRESLEYKLWRTAVFERDSYTCIWCGDNKGGNLEADHIKPFYLYPELRFAIDNGRTLCHKCHQTTTTYGKKGGE